MNSKNSTAERTHGSLHPACSATMRVIGECTMNYDPRSLSLDLCPTKLVLTFEPMESSAAVNHMHRCIEAAPTWTFRLERVESPND